MTMLSDSALNRLRLAADMPDLSDTRYRLLDKLGQGGMGSVYRVEDSVLKRQVALKVISFEDGNGEHAARLMREARVIAQLEHPGIVPVHDVGTLPDGRVFYAMKLVQGLDLEHHLVHSGTIAARLRLFQKICEAVSFAHAHGVLHRDLKPQNIMVGPFGEVLVMDWGLSKIVNQDDAAENTTPEEASPEIASLSRTASRASDVKTAHGAVLGTPGYMAPEQTHGNSQALDQRADIYSLGAILNFLLSSGLSERTPRALTAIANKAMSEDPAARYSTVQQLEDDTSRFLDGLPVSAYPESILARAWRWAVKNRAWILLIVAYLVMRMLLILWRL